MLASLAEPNISGYMQKMKTSFYSLSVVFIAAVALTLVSQSCFAAHHAGSNPEANLEKLGIALPTPSKSIANYVGARRIGNTIFLSGHLPLRKDKSVVIGKLGKALTVEEGYQAARLSAIALLATLKTEVGDLKTSRNQSRGRKTSLKPKSEPLRRRSSRELGSMSGKTSRKLRSETEKP